MRTINSNMITGLLVASLVCFLAMDFAEARRGGGGGGGRGMSRGGPAASGSFQRSRVQPQRRTSQRTTNRATKPQQRTVNQDRAKPQQRDVDQDRVDQRQDNRQDRFDQRQDNIDQRQDNREKVYDDRKEYYDDRNEWYEDRWRRGAYISVSSWNSMNCRYNMTVVNSITYYDCNGVRYERVYRGGQTVYIIVN